MSHKEKAKVFITHSWRDIAFTRQLTEDLKNEGLDVWFDEKSVAAGGRVAEEINKGLEECDVYIPILSDQALASEWCWEEINTAINLSNRLGRKRRPRIVPVLIQDCETKIPAIISARLYIKFTGRPYEESFCELLKKAFGILSTKPGRCPSETEKLYAEGIHASIDGNWLQAVSAFERVLELDRFFLDSELRLEEARRQITRKKVSAGIIVGISLALLFLSGLGALNLYRVSSQRLMLAVTGEPTGTAPAVSATAVPLASPTFLAWTNTPSWTPTPTPEPTRTASPSPTASVIPPSNTPYNIMVTPTFTPSPTPTKTPTPTPTPTPWFGFVNLRWEPSQPRGGDDVTFYINFNNTLSESQYVKWRIEVCKTDCPRWSELFFQTEIHEDHIPPGGTFELVSTLWPLRGHRGTHIYPVRFVRIDYNDVRWPERIYYVTVTGPQ